MLACGRADVEAALSRDPAAQSLLEVALLHPGTRQPTIGDRVTVGAGAKILGNLVVGPDSRIGANVVLLHSVEAGSVIDGTCPGGDLAPHHRTPTSQRTP
jgi:serine acetyltransferase